MSGSSSIPLAPLTATRDGKLSVEHHISINIMDALAIMSGSEKSLTMKDVLQTFQYIYDQRIRGGKQPHLDKSVMLRFVSILMLIMKTTRGKLRKELTEEADQAFKLFGDFLETVEEFQKTVEEKSISDLKFHLKIDRRLDTPVRQEQAVRVLGLLSTIQKFADWKALVSPSFYEELEPKMADFAASSVGGRSSSDTTLPPEGVYYDVEAKTVLQAFHSDPDTGLSSADIGDRLEKYGFNTLPQPPAPSVWKMLWTQVTDFMVLILLAAAAVSAGFGDYKACVVLVIVVILNVCIGFVQEFKAERALSSLMSLEVPQATVLRDGKQAVVPSRELVPGDIVLLDEGAAVPADLRLIEAAQLYTIESVLTGESLPVEKHINPIIGKSRAVPLGDRRNMAFMSTGVTRGRGKGIVVSSGHSTEVGKISGALASVASKTKKTPLQRKLSKLGKWLVGIALILCILVVVIGVVRGNNLMNMIKTGISLAVSVIPEGLVAVVTITMALGVQRMAKRNAIVRKLPSVETLGSVTTICSDKTGTLTEGKMKASEIYVEGKKYTFSGSGEHPDGGLVVTSEGNNLDRNPDNIPASLRTALMICALCNNASITKGGEDENEANEWSNVGDPTEVALVVASHKAGLQKEFWIESSRLQTVCEFAFDSDRKRMSTIYSVGNPAMGLEEGAIIVAKGASESILKLHSLDPPF
eukprot:TRINITY_DN5519_c0_g1_i1.p1 TRINITY_DN5519_c0_g1~~TRINITY_DN5519_c0_g1_i1.p1  ORF type:complete len:699 (-),score=251.22 TRINITY_DN5519_c0_g1_i1:1329-3425(-)